jgi:hypothetical protein
MLEPHMAEKKHQEESKLHTLNPQPIQSFSTPHYSEKTERLPCHQMPAPNMLERRRPTGEQIIIAQYSQSHPWEKPA